MRRKGTICPGMTYGLTPSRFQPKRYVPYPLRPRCQVRDCDFPISVLQTSVAAGINYNVFSEGHATDRRTDGQTARRIAVGGQGRLTPQLLVGDQPPHQTQ